MEKKDQLPQTLSYFLNAPPLTGESGKVDAGTDLIQITFPELKVNSRGENWGHPVNTRCKVKSYGGDRGALKEYMD